MNERGAAALESASDGISCHALAHWLANWNWRPVQTSKHTSLSPSFIITHCHCLLPSLAWLPIIGGHAVLPYFPSMDERTSHVDGRHRYGWIYGWMDGWLSWMWTIVDIRRYIHKWLINNTIITTIEDVIQFANILLKYSFQQYFFSFFVLNGIYLVLCPQAKTSLNQSSVYHKYMYM